DAEEQVEEVHRPAPARPEEVEEQSVRATVEAAGAKSRREHAENEPAPRRRQAQRRDPEAVEAGGRDQDPPPPEALGERPAAERPERVSARVEEVDEPDAGVVLAERRLDRADQRRHEQPGPAD